MTNRTRRGRVVEERRWALLKGFGERVERLRTEKGWSRVELAGRLGVSREWLAKWEWGKSAPPFRVLAKISRVLGVTLDELLTGQPPAEEVLAAGDPVIASACLGELATMLLPWRAQDRDGERRV